MLSAWLHAKDLGKAWAPVAGGWGAGSSAIQPYQHSALHAGMFVSPRRTAVIVRERIYGQPQPESAFSVRNLSERAFDNALEEARQWPLEFLELLIVRREGAHQVTLRCGHWGTAPVYLLVRHQVLHVNWDVTGLYKYLTSARLEPAFTAQYLLGLSHPYSRQTIFPGVSMLTERSKAVWHSPFKSVRINYPSPEKWAKARRLKPNARVVSTFREILSSSMRRWLPSEDQPVAMELSGGLDSSIVAAMAASITTRPVQSYGMIMPGVFGNYQRARRNEVVGRFRLSDSTFPCLDHPPFNPKSHRVRGRRVVPWAEFYEEAVGTLLGRVASDGAAIIFTGMGGDELCSYQAGEVDGRIELDENGGFSGVAEADAELSENQNPYPPFVTEAVMQACEDRDALIDDAPRALMDSSSLESAAAVSTLYLRSKVWPISPLCTPELVEFCRKLPLKWRHERIIERKVLTSFGCSPLVAYPKPDSLENFCDVMDFALREASSGIISRLFHRSRLADQGFVDRTALITAYKQFRDGDKTYSDRLLGAVMLELTIRSLERHQTDRSQRPRRKA